MNAAQRKILNLLKIVWDFFYNSIAQFLGANFKTTEQNNQSILRPQISRYVVYLTTHLNELGWDSVEASNSVDTSVGKKINAYL